MVTPRDLKITSRTTANGYVYVGVPGHPYAKKPGWYVYEHRFVMERHLDRFLNPSELVHHEDENKKNNRLRNLELKSRSAHSRHHSSKRGRPPVTLHCAECKKPFERKGRRFPKNRKSGKYFCSRSCNMRHYVKLGVVRWKTIPKHGTVNMYGYHGCRCELCREVMRVAQAKYRKRKG